MKASESPSGNGETRGPLTRLLPFAGLFCAAFFLYLKTFGFSFIPTWDDDVYVINNVFIRSISFENLRAVFTSSFGGNYAPLQILSYMADHALWGLDPRGYHLTNIMLHAVNSCLVYTVLKKISGNGAASLAAAFVFAVHPVNVENVAWVTERKALLAGVFFFLSLLSYLRFRETGRLLIYLTALFSFTAGMLSKTSVVILPAVLLIHELILVREEGRRTNRLLPLLPFFLISAAGSAGVIFIHLRDSVIEQGALSAGTLFGTVYPTMMTVFWKYAGLLAWPLNLSGFYDTTVYKSFFDAPVVLSVFAWLLLSLYIFLRTGRQSRFWYLWAWVCLLPVSNLVIPLPVYFADRYMYLSCIGVFMLCGLGLTRMVERHGLTPGRLSARIFFNSAVVLAGVFFAAVSWQRLEVWQNDISFWEDTVKRSPEMYVPHVNLGAAYERNKRFDEAERQYLAARGIYENPQVELNLRIVRIKMGKETFR